MASLVGKRFGSYQVEELLGEGGMASVYRAQHVVMHRDVALKIVRPELADMEMFIRRFEREAQTVAGLSHPHILKIFEFGQVRKTAFLAMELLTGGSLSATVRHEALPLDRVARILAHICSALEYAHNLGIVHRDLKPQNVMLDAEGNAILTDFGLARMMDTLGQPALTQTGAQMGTPAYMSPEQWRGQPVDGRADIYALGVMLFEMLSGQAMYPGQTPHELLHSHLFVAPPALTDLRPELPTVLETVIERATAKERDDRYPSARALLEAFRAAIAPFDADVSAFSSLESMSDTPALKVSSSKAAAQEQAALARIEAERMGFGTRPTPTAGRMVGALPQDVTERWIGRAEQVNDTAALLTEKARLVSIYGRAGVGKTALACKVLADLRADDALDGIVSLNVAAGEAQLDRVLADFGRLLGGAERGLLEALARDGNIPDAQKTSALLEKLAGGRYVLYLDGLETQQDPASGELLSAELRTFFEVVLERGGGLALLITSREPLSLSRHVKTWERMIALDEGLPVDEAVALLRAFDPDGAAGLRDGDEPLLREVAEGTAGFPRALETVAGLLLEDPLTTIEDLLRDMNEYGGEAVSSLVAQSMERLSAQAVRVIHALSIFQRPVKQTALEYLLAPFMDATALRNQLSRLVRTYFVTFNKASGLFALHPLEREMCCLVIPRHSQDGFDWNTLQRRAADYYREIRKPQTEWRSIEDVRPQLAEFEHRCEAGDYDDAARALLTIDRDYLWEWGERTLLHDLHHRLEGKVSDERLAHEHRRRLAWLHFFSNLDEAIPMFEALKADAERLGDRKLIADALDDLAQTQRGKSNMPEGFRLHQMAYDIYSEIGDRRGMADALGGMGAVAYYAFPEIAVDYLERAETIQRELGNLPSLAYLLGVGGSAYGMLGDFDRAIAKMTEAVNLARSLGIVQSLALGLAALAETYCYHGEYQKGYDTAREALEIAERVSGGEVTHIVIYASSFLAIAETFLKQTQTAIERLQRLAVRIGPEFPARIILHGVLSTLLVMDGQVAEARKVIEPLLHAHLSPQMNIDQAVILARAGETERALAITREALERLEGMSPNRVLCAARGLGLAVQGVLLGDAALVEQSAEQFRQMRSFSSAPGYIVYYTIALDTLRQMPGGDILAPALAAVQGD